MNAGYARVSTKDQTADLQVDALKKAGCTKVYKEVMSPGELSTRVCRFWCKLEKLALWR